MSYTRTPTTPASRADAKSDFERHSKWNWIVMPITLFLAVLVMYRVIQWDRHEDAMAAASVRFFIRLASAEGFDDPSLPSPQSFHLVVDADGVSARYKACSGGGNSMLRVSYHGMILAWAQVPSFCIEGGNGSVREPGVVTMEAKAEAAVLREDVRRLVWSEKHVAGKAEFEVEGEVEGLGYLRCMFFLFNTTTHKNEGTPCLVDR